MDVGWEDEGVVLGWDEVRVMTTMVRGRRNAGASWLCGGWGFLWC